MNYIRVPLRWGRQGLCEIANSCLKKIVVFILKQSTHYRYFPDLVTYVKEHKLEHTLKIKYAQVQNTAEKKLT